MLNYFLSCSHQQFKFLLLDKWMINSFIFQITSQFSEKLKNISTRLALEIIGLSVERKSIKI